ncbi:20627_t:CDS:2 [Funneliformis geosporum]|uniref:5029_t:CDS:1 n=1 Tax=Funneliformis geosporum TaxID=1117311 RepID=A0A9W4WY15_9GLOM|nr:20627_t:CDS:2 [Funneliformis geosporum]CAI2180760.1 5029_t:CDS:2 [Funneliformis geosporum]
MKPIKSIIFTVTLLLGSLIISVSSEPLNLDLKVNKDYKIARVPPNNGTWKTCGRLQTMKVMPPLTPVTVDYGVSVVGDAPGGGDGSGVYAYLVDFENSKKMPLITPIASLSCFSTLVTYCNHDAGEKPLAMNLYYCLIVQNPYASAQKIAVAFSDDETVFGDGGFTSPDSNGETGATGTL